jgi:GAF domain-containing protein
MPRHGPRLQAGVAVIDALHSVGVRLTAQLELGRLVQDATDAATTATTAGFGAFFYNLIDQYGESYTLYTISGVSRERFTRFPMPRNTAVFAPTFDGADTVRSDDIVADPRFGRNPPYNGMPAGHLPVHSYLAVPVKSPTTGEVLGGFFFGHEEPGRFTGRHAYLTEGIAAYTAIAMDNARLLDRERTSPPSSPGACSRHRRPWPSSRSSRGTSRRRVAPRSVATGSTSSRCRRGRPPS